MEAVVIVTVLALLQYVYFGVQVGGIRGKTGVKAPAMSGDDQFERMNRVHQNTLEQLVLLIPVLWIYAHYVNPMWGAGLAVVYIIGRFIYRAAYLKDPGSRTLGFMLSFLPSAVMAIWVLVSAVMHYL
ncbi:MAG: MAPEG family protein [Pseudomonadota bacterium]